MTQPGLATLLLLADGRLPAGGHAHSGGLEAAVAGGRVFDLPTLDAFLRGRLATTGFVAAAFAAATALHATTFRHTAAHGSGVHELAATELDVTAWDAGLDARTPSPALRKASRAQGRALLRAGRAMWTLPPLRSTPDGLHQSVALGVVAAAAGLSPGHAALVAAHASVTGSASAAVRLLALDPYPVHGLLARLADACDETAARAANLAHLGVPELPAASAPLVDISAEHHSAWEVRLFAS